MAKRRAKRHKLGQYSGGVIEIYGFEELARKISEFGTKALNDAVYSALKESEKPVKDYMVAFMDSHLEGKPIPFPYTQDTLPRGEGQSNRYYTSHVYWKGNQITMVCGFEKRDYVKGDHDAQRALQALFLDVGTKDALGNPRITPTFFMYYAVNNNLDTIRALQKNALIRSLQKWWNDNQIVVEN